MKKLKKIEDVEKQYEMACIRAKSQRWGDKADKYERDVLHWKRTKLRKNGR